MEVGNEQVRFGRVGQDEDEPAPGAAGIERAGVVPGAEQAEDPATVITVEEAIGFVYTPDERRGANIQDLPLDEPLEVRACGQLLIPMLIWRVVEIELVSNPLGDGEEEGF